MSPPDTLQDVALDSIPAYIPGTGPAYARLTVTDIGLALALHDEGKSQVEIAQRLGVTQASISRLLKKLSGDSSVIATRLLKARAYRSAIRVAHIAEKGRADEALKAAKVVLTASGVLSTDTNINVGVQVQIGMPGQGVGPALRDITVVSAPVAPVESTG